MIFFLIVYDRTAGEIREMVQFPPSKKEEALKERAERELQEREHPEIEVVVLGAASLEDLKKTHRRYFDSARELIVRAS